MNGRAVSNVEQNLERWDHATCVYHAAKLGHLRGRKPSECLDQRPIEGGSAHLSQTPTQLRQRRTGRQRISSIDAGAKIRRKGKLPRLERVRQRLRLSNDRARWMYLEYDCSRSVGRR
ncbi:MAG: hypothetical protein ACJAYU_000131 [Bradymonadia bacterium]|jgi:hypothetical protein